MTAAHMIRVADLEVEVIRKNIKNLHLGVYPPDGRVRVATPLKIGEDTVRRFTIARLSWIRQQRQAFEKQERQTAREYVSGESHYFAGRRYRLQVMEQSGKGSVEVKTSTRLVLSVPVGSDKAKREATLTEWYRQQLKTQLGPIVKKWSKLLGVEVPEWRTRRMKTKWGSCNASARRIWLNLELAKQPPQCVEYVVVHELMHLLERHHNKRFQALLDLHLPNWRTLRDELKEVPLG